MTRYWRLERGPSPLKSALILAVLAFVAFAAVRLGAPNLFAPASFAPAIYDGWQPGALDTCPSLGPWVDPAKRSAAYCDANLAVWLSTAREGFDRRDPAHAPVVRATLHELAGFIKYTTGCCEVAVFELGDGTVRAIGVWPPLESDSRGAPFTDYSRVVTMDYGPDK